jgi:hypothetical protein
LGGFSGTAVLSKVNFVAALRSAAFPDVDNFPPIEVFTGTGFVVDALADATLDRATLAVARFVDAVLLFAVVALAVEAFVVAVLADVARVVDAFSSGSGALLVDNLIVPAVDAFSASSSSSDTEACVVCAGLVVIFAGFGTSTSESTCFARPRRAGAFSTLDFTGESGGVAFVCARCALVRTILP